MFNGVPPHTVVWFLFISWRHYYNFIVECFQAINVLRILYRNLCMYVIIWNEFSFPYTIFFLRFRLSIDIYIYILEWPCFIVVENVLTSEGIIDILRDLMDIVWTWSEFTLWENINGLHLTTLEYVMDRVLCVYDGKFMFTIYISILICSIINLRRTEYFLCWDRILKYYKKYIL